MNLTIKHNRFSTQDLRLVGTGIFARLALLNNGLPVEGIKGRYILKDDRGKESFLRVTKKWLDPVPDMRIDDEPIALAPPLKWHEWLWIGLPALLILAGGALGGVIGFIAAKANAKIFRDGTPAPARQLKSILVTIVAAVSFLVVASTLRGLLH